MGGITGEEMFRTRPYTDSMGDFTPGTALLQKIDP
jgi:hypothetical protein